MALALGTLCALMINDARCDFAKYSCQCWRKIPANLYLHLTTCA